MLDISDRESLKSYNGRQKKTNCSFSSETKTTIIKAAKAAKAAKATYQLHTNTNTHFKYLKKKHEQKKK